MLEKQLPARYTNLKLMNKTMNSSVYKGYDKYTNDDVIIKLVSSASSFYKDFFEEFKILFQFNHPNLMEVLDFGFCPNDSLYYTMPYYKKIDPIKYCAKNGVKKFLEIFVQILNGIEYLHNRKKLHGDLTIDNIIFYLIENKIRVKISDFGLSSLLVTEKITHISGTAKYIAPEIISSSNESHFSKASDYYSIGVILYEILTGKPPFQKGNTIDIMKQHIKEKIPAIKPLFKIEPKIVNTIKKMLLKDPQVRLHSSEIIFKTIKPLLVRYNIKIDSLSKFSDNIHFSDTIKFYRKKPIMVIKNKLKQNIQCLNLIGSNSVYFNTTLKYLTYSLKADNFYVITNNKLINHYKHFSEILKHFKKIHLPDISSQKLKNLKLIILITDKIPKNILWEIISYINSHPLSKLIYCTMNKTKLQNIKTHHYKINPLSSQDISHYLNLLLGFNVMSENIKNWLTENSARDMAILEAIINHWVKLHVIEFQNSKIIIKSTEDYKIIPDSTKQKFKNQVNDLDNDLKNTLIRLSYWKDKFTLEEITKIFGNQTTAFYLTRLNKLKKLGLLLQTSRYIQFKYPFLKKLIRQLNPKSEKIKAKIQDYLEKKTDLDIEEKEILINLYCEKKQYKKIIKIAENFLGKDKNKHLKRIIGDFIIDNIEKFSIDKNKNLVFYLLEYQKILTNLQMHKKASKLLETIKNIARKTKNKKIIPELYVREFEDLINKNQYKELIEKYKKSNHTIKHLSKLQELQIQEYIAKSYRFLHKFDKAIELHKNILTSNNMQNQHFKIISYCELAYINFEINDFRKSLSYYKKGFKLAKKILTKNEQACFYIRLSFTYSSLYKFNKAKTYLEKARVVMHNNSGLDCEFSINSAFSYFYYKKGNLWNALLYCKSKNSRLSDYNFEQITTLTKVLTRLGYYSQTIHILKKVKFKNNKYFSYKNLFTINIIKAISYYNKGSIKKAITLIEDNIKKEKEFNNKKFYLNYFYRIYFQLQLNKMKHANEGIEYIKSNVKPKSIDENILHSFILAKYNFLENHLEKAANSIDKAISKYEKYGNVDFDGQKIYFLAYKIKKAAFNKQIILENYKLYLKKAKSIIDTKIQYLPGSYMKKHFKNLKENKIILERFENEKETETYEHKFELLQIVKDVTEIVSQLSSQKELFTKILELVVKTTGTERGLIITKDNDKQNIEYIYRITDDAIDDVKSISNKMIKDVISKKKYIYITDIENDSETFNKYQSFINLKIKSVICLPLIIHNKLLGVIYLDSRKLLAFTPEEIQFLKIIAQISASAIETSKKYGKLKQEKENLSKIIKESSTPHPHIIGNSNAIKKILKQVEQIAPTDVNVLIEGDSGTGKELIAKDIHRLSKRKDKPLLTIDCGSLSENLIESELFGYRKGAFTGAISDKEGIFECSHKGTVFLDEISNIPPKIQTKLLRIIQEGEIKRLGENRIRKVDVRIITASNKPLKELVAQGKFRQDLYFRLSIFPIKVPDLKERRDDIEILARHYLKIYANNHNKNLKEIDEETISLLRNYNWPGNVRELKNLIERAVILSPSNAQTLTKHYFKNLYNKDNILMKNTNFNEQVNKFKLNLINKVLKMTDGHKTEAAKILGLSRQNFSQILKRLKEKS